MFKTSYIITFMSVLQSMGKQKLVSVFIAIRVFSSMTLRKIFIKAEKNGKAGSKEISNLKQK